MMIFVAMEKEVMMSKKINLQKMCDELIKLAQCSSNMEIKALAASMATLYKKTIEIEKRMKKIERYTQKKMRVIPTSDIIHVLELHFDTAETAGILLDLLPYELWIKEDEVKILENCWKEILNERASN